MLDASVLAALYVDDPATEQSEAALVSINGEDLHAPDFVVLEVANVLWKRVRRDELHAGDAMTAITDLSAASIQFHPIGGLVAQSLALALAHGFTAYDATYVALATRVGGIVVTNDGAMRQRGIEAGLAVVTPSEVI
ncbi:MAG TPA: type II toxin-antitoxin system VapC family toxin [Solirubrobacteraceae bacterium]|nr:type II toxin-antitoxin system VapC family toxin [Solirubrobacteraceae bacterium]